MQNILSDFKVLMGNLIRRLLSIDCTNSRLDAVHNLCCRFT